MSLSCWSMFKVTKTRCSGVAQVCTPWIKGSSRIKFVAKHELWTGYPKGVDEMGDQWDLKLSR